MPLCRRCGEAFPASAVIDGKRRALSSRRYCLTCSPFGQHNTRPLHLPRRKLARTCEVCGDTYAAGRGHYATTCQSCRVVRRRQELKRLAVEHLGGSCQVCGYARCSAALQFHHRDPAEKDFAISHYSRSWERLRAELEKCLLLCANCHAEAHAGIITLDLPP